MSPELELGCSIESEYYIELLYTRSCGLVLDESNRFVGEKENVLKTLSVIPMIANAFLYGERQRYFEL